MSHFSAHRCQPPLFSISVKDCVPPDASGGTAVPRTGNNNSVLVDAIMSQLDAMTDKFSTATPAVI